MMPLIIKIQSSFDHCKQHLSGEVCLYPITAITAIFQFLRFLLPLCFKGVFRIPIEASRG